MSSELSGPVLRCWRRTEGVYLVGLVCLVYLVCFVHRTKETRQTRETKETRETRAEGRPSGLESDAAGFWRRWLHQLAGGGGEGLNVSVAAYHFSLQLAQLDR